MSYGSRRRRERPVTQRKLPVGTAARIASGATTALALMATATAHAGSTPGVDFDLNLSSQQPGSLTAATLRILYKNPSDPNAKPSPVRRLTVKAPDGTRFDGAAVPRCAASDSDLMLNGRDACPAASRVGSGTLTVMTGFGAPFDPFATDVTLFNSGDGVIELVTAKGTNAELGVDRTKFTGPGTISADPPKTPGGPPDGESAVREVLFTYDAVRGPGGKRFITTPQTCPSSRLWTSALSTTDAAGATYSTTSATTCLPAVSTPRHGPRRKARMRLSVAPRRVVAATPTRFRIRVRSANAGCRRRARIRFAGRRLRNSASGRADAILRINRPGRYEIVVTSRGCTRASVHVLVRPRRARRRR